MSCKEYETKRKKILLRKLIVKAVELRVVISAHKTWKIKEHNYFPSVCYFLWIFGKLDLTIFPYVIRMLNIGFWKWNFSFYLGF